MDKELKDLKSVLRSLVVSSPAAVDSRSLARDYRNMVGTPVPIAKYGYRDLVTFLKERCDDCFLFQGMQANPTLTLIVPDSLKHIDQFVQRQKCTAVTKMKGKRRSVEVPTRPPERSKNAEPTNMIYQTFVKNQSARQNSSEHPKKPTNHLSEQSPKHDLSEAKSYHPSGSSSNVPPQAKSNNYQSETKSNHHRPEENSNHHRQPEPKSNYHRPIVKSYYQKSEEKPNYNPPETKPSRYSRAPEIKSNYRLPEANNYDYQNSNKNTEDGMRSINNNISHQSNETSDIRCKPSVKRESSSEDERERVGSSVSEFLKRRQLPYAGSQLLSREDYPSKEDDDSGRQTSSSQSSRARALLDELTDEVLALIRDHEGGVLATDILRLYRERYSRELPLSRCRGSINGLLEALGGRVRCEPERAAVRVRDAACAPPRAVRALPGARAAVRAPRAPHTDPDDALPGIDFEPDVFPADCLHFLESVPAPRLAARRGDMLEVAVGEVYSPSHFWLQLLGRDHRDAMHAVMDEMTAYYGSGDGRERSLARGAVRAGHYCASLYERDWHRALIVKVIDADTVKVRHIDYGTVESVPARSLKPLVRAWGALPAQAVRARLAGLRPGAAGRRWPRAAAAAFLARVRDRLFIANVVAVDHEEGTLETFLIDTSGPEDACVSAELVRAGHADARADSALRSGDCYLFPTWEALETGDTPNYADIHRYLADGISLEYVEAYRRHVPAALPALAGPPAGLAPASPPPASSPPASPPPTSPTTASPPPASPPSDNPPTDSPPTASPLSTSPQTASPPSASPPTNSPPPSSLLAACPPPPLRPQLAPPAPAPAPAAAPPWLPMYHTLLSLDPLAAHCYLLTAVRREAAAAAPPPPPLDPWAPEFFPGIPPAAPYYLPPQLSSSAGLLPPPGFAAPPGFAPPVSFAAPTGFVPSNEFSSQPQLPYAGAPWPR